MRPSGLFWMWAGAIWNVEFLVYGALIVSFGLSFWQAVLAILIGNVFYVVLGIASLWGPATGTTAFMVSRAPFGRNGNRAPSLFNWITQVGFEIEGLVIVVLIIEAMFSHEGTSLNDAAKVVVIVCAVAVQFIAPFLGHATIIKVLRYLSYVFIVVFIVMAILVIPHAHRVEPAPAHLVVALDDCACAHRLGRRTWMDRERRRLLALPALEHAQSRRPSGPRRSGRRSPPSCSSFSELPPTW